MQSKGGATPPARPATPAVRQAARTPVAGATAPASTRPVVVPPPVPAQARSESPLSRAEVEAQHRARVQAKAQTEAQARIRAQAKAKAQVQAEAQARARAQAQAQARQSVRPAATKPPASALQRASGRAGGEELAALHSRERVAESLAKVQAAERKVADALPGHTHDGTRRHAAPSIAENIRTMFRDRNRIREAFVLSEILGPARGNPISTTGPLGGR